MSQYRRRAFLEEAGKIIRKIKRGIPKRAAAKGIVFQCRKCEVRSWPALIG